MGAALTVRFKGAPLRIMIGVALCLLFAGTSAAQDSPKPPPLEGIKREVDYVIGKPTGKNGYEEFVLAGYALWTSPIYLAVEERGPDATIAELRRAMEDESVKKAFRLLREGLAKPVRYPRTPGQIGFDTLFPELANFRKLSRCIAMQERLLIADGRTGDAVETFDLGVRFARALPPATMIHYLVALAITNNVSKPMSEHPDLLSAEECVRIQTSCNNWLRHSGDLTTALRSRSHMVAHLYETMLGPGVPHLTEYFAYRDSINVMTYREIVELNAKSPSGMKALQVEALRCLNDFYDRTIAEASKPFWMTAVPKAVSSNHLALTLVSEMNVFSDTLSKNTQCDAKLKILADYCAIRRYQLLRKELPKRLADLQLGDLAIDPFTGKLMDYEVETDGFRLESAGGLASPGDPTAVNGRIPITITGPAQSKSRSEPGAPAAAAPAAVLIGLAEVDLLDNRIVDALADFEKAVAAARRSQDAAGEALGLASSAGIHEKQSRTADAANSWAGAARAWKAAGYSPGRVKALCAAARLMLPTDPRGAEQLLREAAAAGFVETVRPSATAAALLEVATSPEWGAARAQPLYLAALGLYEHSNLDRSNLARTLNNLGVGATALGDLTAAESYYRRALALSEKDKNDEIESEDAAVTLYNLADILLKRGDRSQARELHRRALALRESFTDISPEAVFSLERLAVIADEDGDLAAARDYYYRALEIRRKETPDTIAEAWTLDGLGRTYSRLGDLAAARAFCERALALRRKLEPNSLDLASSLNSMGILNDEQERRAEARGCYEEAMSIYELKSSGTIDSALVMNNLADVFRHEGATPHARELYLKAAAIYDRLAPESPNAAVTIKNLGELALLEGDSKSAHTYLEHALSIDERSSPRVPDDAELLADLSKLDEKDGNLVSARELAQRVWGVVRKQAAGITGDETRQVFGKRLAACAANLVRLETNEGNVEEALRVLEEGRGQSLLALLGERGLTQKTVPKELWDPYAVAQLARDRAQKALEEAVVAEDRTRRILADARDQEAGETEIRNKQDAVDAAGRGRALKETEYAAARAEADGQWAALRNQLPFMLSDQVVTSNSRRCLSTGTIYAAFSVGEDESTLFLIAANGPVRAFRLPVPRKELEARVAFVKRSVSQNPGGRGPQFVTTDAETRVDAARTLFQKLFPADARAEVARAKRLVVSPDGPLWDLPFAALVSNADGRPEYLGLRTPLVYTQSLALYSRAVTAEMNTSGGNDGAGSDGAALVVGNPLYDNERRAQVLAPGKGNIVVAANRSVHPSGTIRDPINDELLRGSTPVRGERGLLTRDVPQQLPGAEVEARKIARLYGTQAAIGALPTEKWFRQNAGKARLIHLATHGYFNSRLPMSSGVLLAVPEKFNAENTNDDGVLQAWELFELPLRAELVVLSACESGLGAEVEGEGLVGLTRAFQFAGARSVVASQWFVSDSSTSSLMTRFHDGLRRGLAKDEAMRQAMVAVSAEPSTAHPYYWAPFFLMGSPLNGGLGQVAAQNVLPAKPASASGH